MTRAGTLELCSCGCTQQVHELTEGECGNPECPVKCQKFEGTGKYHESAFCKVCTVMLPNCICVEASDDERYNYDS